MPRNVLQHRIKFTELARHGAIAGALAAVIMAFVSMVLDPIITSNLSFWSFPKLVSTIVLGTGGADPVSTFEVLPVMIGLALHLAIGALLGALFALLIAEFDIEEPAPVLLVGLVFGAVSYTILWSLVGQNLFPRLGEETVVVPVIGHLAFGVVMGATFASWQAEFDEDFVQSEFDPAVDASTTRRPEDGVHATRSPH